MTQISIESTTYNIYQKKEILLRALRILTSFYTVHKCIFMCFFKLAFALHFLAQ